MNLRAMRIEHLIENQSHVSLVASWQHAEFGYLNPSINLVDRTEKLRQSLVSNGLPIVLLALSDEGTPIGAASILATTLTHKHLTPWLSTIVVPPENRRKGIATALSLRALMEAAKIGLETLYLFTPRSESLYARIGWKTFDRLNHNGLELAIMSRSTQALNKSFDMDTPVCPQLKR